MHVGFELDKEEATKLELWLAEHDPVCPRKGKGSIGGRLTYCFTPTSLGTASKIECSCGKEVDVTDYGSW